MSNSARQAIRISVLSVLSLSLGAAAVHAQATQTAPKTAPKTEAQAPAPAATQKPYEPEVGQAGKDVVWVPTPQALVEKMLDMAKVTPKDYVIDLGSGDGRTVIAAAKRGARAHGIEYNPDMVELSKRNAEKEGVAGKATFEKADLYKSDFSKAQVITMFLLPTINMKLRPILLDMKPGTRIVSNSFTMEDWQADETATVDKDCTSWCTAYLWIVPAKVEGTWTMPQGTLTLKRQFQMVTGTLGSAQIQEGKVTGEDITFKVGGVTYNGKIAGNTMSGAASGASNGNWTATREGPPPPPAK
jgi:precorrin-6B methylase 2